MRAFILAGLVAAFTLCCVDPADARLFEPQANWWTSGSTCVATRAPPGRRWRALPPRSCTRSSATAPDREAVHARELPAQAAQSKRKASAEAA